jgi:hypothetical protein
MGRVNLRGYRLGHSTAEVDHDTDLALRVPVRFACPHGHEFTVQLAADAERPASWTCRHHGVEVCRRMEHASAPVLRTKPARTHLVMLHERRTTAELDALLAGTLAALRRQGGARQIQRDGRRRRPYSSSYGSV